MDHKYSKVPIEHLGIYLKDCINVAKYIVSVGCGTGIYESELCKQIKSLREKLILVDPAPTSFSEVSSKSQHGFQTDYAYVADLVKDKPQVISNCVLLLIWPYTDHYTISEKYTNPSGEVVNLKIDFDIEAVNLLHPVSIVCLYEKPDSMTNGASGSLGLLNLLYNPEVHDYKLISSTKYGFKGTMGNIYPQIRWIAKKGSKVPKEKKCLSLNPDTASEIDTTHEQVCVKIGRAHV